MLKTKKTEIKEDVMMLVRHVNFAVNLKPLLDKISELERLARIGRATEKILSTNDSGFGPTMLIGDEYGDLNLYSVEDLLEWSESEGE